MCGITGFIDRRGDGGMDQLSATAQQMGRQMRHRGPDDAGVWCDPDAGLAFSQQRLSIVDLSAAGHQPMVSSCGRWIINYNGEIYNTEELRAQLQAAGRPFRGHSDTEVIVEGCAVWGIEETLKKLIGMFAMAVWDRRAKCLYLARDRMGIKPLYYGQFGSLFLFGSELWALRAHPGWTPEIDHDAVATFLRHNYIPAPLSIYRGINKLQPGTILRLAADQEAVVEPFWSLDDVASEGQENCFAGTDQEAVSALDDLLYDAVKRRMVADVPIGAFLSGGIDSSTVVALMQRASDRPVKTFSIGFHEREYNEAQHAADVARHLGTEHTELYVTSEQAQAVIPKLASIYDEPFADASQIPTYLVSEMTREHVTVSLSGDGGDELFAGYNRYFRAGSVNRFVAPLPVPVRRALAGGIKSISPKAWDSLFKFVPGGSRIGLPGDKAHKLADVLCEDENGFYRRLVTHWEKPDEIVTHGSERKGILWNPEITRQHPDFVNRMRYWDMLTYLPDDILTKVDRASMAVSLEARVPILDHRVVEFAWRLPQEMMIREGKGKWILRQVLDRYVPKSLVERPKMGFGVPIDSWLRGPLKEWAGDLLSEETINRHGLVQPEIISKRWQSHLSEERNWQYPLWDILMLHAWMDGAGAVPGASVQIEAQGSSPSSISTPMSAKLATG